MNYHGPERRRGNNDSEEAYRIRDESSRLRHSEITETFITIEINLAAINSNLRSLKDVVEKQSKILFGESGANGLAGSVRQHSQILADYSKTKSTMTTVIILSGIFVIMSPYIQMVLRKFIGE